jgi:DNA-binding GntR family transcriptional regulator
MARSMSTGRKGAASGGVTARKRTRGAGATGVYEQLRREILELKMEPGTLLDETDLAARFRLSRSPVREALIRLSAEGLVQTLRNRSSIVAPFDIVAVPSYLDAMDLVYRLTSRLAAMNRRPSELAVIHELQKEHAAATRRGDAAAMIRLNCDFHEAIAKASGNSFYVAWARQVLDQGQRILGLYLHDVGDQVSSHSISEHVPLVRAIEQQDPDAAEDAARRDAQIIADQMKQRFGARPSTSFSVGDRAGR